MAFFFNDYSSSGLNDISFLGLPFDPSVKHSTSCPSLSTSNSSPLRTNTNNSSNTINTDDTMSDSNKSNNGGGFGSRIPRINFGFRKQAKNVPASSSATSVPAGSGGNSNWSERSTPEGCEDSPPVTTRGGGGVTAGGTKPVAAATSSSSPRSSNNSSPNVGRSKSLRLPRGSTYVAKFSAQTTATRTGAAPHSKMGNVRDEAEDFYPDDLVDTGSQQFDDFDDLSQPRPYSMSKTSQSGLVRSGSGRPRSNTLAAPSSNPSSRESSPGGLTMSAGSSGGSSGGGGGTAANGPRELERMKFGFGGGGGGYGGSSLSQSDALDDYQDLSSQSTSFSRRSQSFSAKHQTRLRAGSFGAHSNRLQPPGSSGASGGSGMTNRPSRRSKTPTALSQRTSQTGQTTSTAVRNGTTTSKLALSRTSSLGKIKQQSTGIVRGGNENSSSSSPTQSRTRRSSGEQRGKRPSSVVITENAADLNAIAQELSQGDPGDGSSQLEVKTVISGVRGGGRMRPASAKTLSTSALNTRRSHSSIGYSRSTYQQRSDTPDQQNTMTTSSSSSASTSNSSTVTPSTTKLKYLSAGSGRGADKPNRPTSARDYYQHGRRDMSELHNVTNIDEVSDSLLEGQMERAHSVSNFGSNTGDVTGAVSTSAVGHVRRQSSGGSGRGSAPSSGRSTPVHRSASGNRLLGKDTPDGGVISSTSKVSAGLPPRTPYRGSRTKASPSSTPAGINELEGSVLLEADDYRRISNDVKSLKTALLKLKRELQADLEGKSPSGQTPQASRSTTTTPLKVGRSVTTPGVTPGPAHSDLRKKLKAITNERDKALEEVGSCKKELKVKSEKIDSLMAELEKERKKNAELAIELEQVEDHRSRLLDKVERLHADKHNLEARLNTLERASIYEQTFSESWLDELDGECDDPLDDMDPSLGGSDGPPTGKGSRRITERKEMTESEIGDLVQSDGGEGESSEPESAAVCSAPVS